MLAGDASRFLTARQYQAARTTVISTILATDMAHHLEGTAKLKELTVIDKTNTNHREILGKSLVHAYVLR